MNEGNLGGSERGATENSKDQKIALNEVQLADLLDRTQEAHHEYEEGLGRPDEDWAGWYAGFMVKELGPGGISVEELRSLLLDAVADYGVYEKEAGSGGKTPMAWPNRYAGFILGRLEG